AEDNHLNQVLAVRIVEKYGHKVTLANNGQETLQMLKDGDFDLVLMDVQMPIMNGLEATKIIRSGSNIKNPRIPIIAMTANAMEGDRETCLASGMDDYISKPIKVAELLAILKKYSSDKEGETLKTLKKEQITKIKAIEVLGIDENLYRTICDWYLQQAPNIMTSILHATQNKDHETVRNKARALKSMSNTVGAIWVQGVATSVEEAARGNNLEILEGLITRLKDEFDATCKEIRRFVH
ncbi:MAG: response regulator, partial [Thermodesulfovibrionales bacterium]|nr:response regulator [Thermodesulfovibrionales bacterium]